ncbi:MAG: GMC family oxidoreductase N-terminal domain-containing protein [Acetobacteraceae bacterium]|nr:GMC family oxidoreductase N-terminal domain-containing protein [Acetobacteraceae bacterium]
MSRAADGTPTVRAYEQGRVMGGGSSINVQSANRGLPRDFDEWAALGAAGWGWDDVLPYFKKLETDLDCDGPLHGKTGPIPIRRVLQDSWPPYAHAAFEAFRATGLPTHLDQNGEVGDGLFPPAFSNANDQRASTATSYLTAQVRKRPNLSIQAETTVLRLLVSGCRADGVAVRRKDASQATLRGRRVILAAGALQSPAILLRAGIGPGEPLRALGIPVAIERPGVGQNLRDHPTLTFCQYLPPALRLPDRMRRASFLAMRYSSGLEGGSASDMYVTASARAGWHALGSRLALYFLWCNRPHSVGHLRLVSPDPDTHPDIDFNLLSHEADLRRMAQGVRRLVGLVVCKALNRNPGDVFPANFSSRVKRLSLVSEANRRITAVLGRLLDVPAPLRQLVLRTFMLGGTGLHEILSDDRQLEAFIRRNVFGVWHPAGTCRIGRDAGAVVDPTGRVIGSENIWVADASVMPHLPTANTNIPTIMIAEKISDGMALDGHPA